MNFNTPPEEFNVPLAKSNNSTRVIQLENGLECLLITDANDRSTGISLSVNSGSMNDNGVQGLAHLMEHMVFTNSKICPKPYTLIDNIGRAGGEVNAFTTFHQTVFYFEIPNTSKSISEINPEIKSEEPIFNYLMDVFASNIKQPMFNNHLIASEIRDINEEHLNNVSSISKRFYHCLKLLSDSKFQNFTTGSSKTLNLKCKNQLLSYYNKHFIGSNMKLVIKGPQSSNTLQKIVINCFKDISSRPKIQERPFRIFSKKATRQILYVKDEVNIMRVVFPVFDLNDNLIQIVKIWIELLGNEESNSLFELLYQKNLVSELSVFEQLVDCYNLVVIVEVNLTTQGKHRIVFILFSILYFVLMVLRTSEQHLEQFINEFIRTERLRFYYKESEVELMNEVPKLAELMSLVRPEYLFFGYRPMNISSKLFLSHSRRVFCIDNMNVILFSDYPVKQFPEMVSKTHDEHYGFDYLVFKIDDLNVSSEEYQDLAILEFPQNNRFIDSLTPVTIPKISESTINYNVKYELDKRPYLIEHSANFELWFDRGSNYNHKIFTSFELLNIKVRPNCMNFVALELVAELLGDKIKARLYSAERIDFSWSIFTALNSNNSLTFNLNGLTRTYITVLIEFIKIIKNELGQLLATPYSQFMKARVKIRKKYEDMKSDDSLAQSVGILYCLVDENVYSPNEILEAIENIEMKDILLIGNEINNCYTSILINGDCNLETAYQISSTINKLSKHLNPDEASKHLTLLGSYEPLTGKIRFEYPSQNNHCLFYFNLGFRESSYIRTVSKLVEYIIGLQVHKLRYPRKLGYKLGSSLRIFKKVMGIFIFTESNEYNFRTLDFNIEDLLHEIQDYLSNLSEESFKKELLIPCINSIQFTSASHSSPNIVFDMPPSRSSTNFDLVGGNFFEHKSSWEKIINRVYRFEGKNGNERVDIDLLKSVSKAEFLEFFNKKLSPDSLNRSTIVITNEVDMIELETQLDDYIINKRKSVSMEKKLQLLQLKDLYLIKKELETSKFFKKPKPLYRAAQEEKILMTLEDYHHSCFKIPMDQHPQALEPYRN